MDFKLLPGFMLSVFILVGLGMAINPQMFFYKIRSKTGKKIKEYEIQPGSTVIVRLFGLFFAVFAFLMLLSVFSSPY